MLTELDLRPEYTKGSDDIASAFYLPCLQRAQRYDRITGYFSSAVLVLAWPAMRNFVKRQGVIRLICSPALSAADIAALQQASDADTDDILAAALLAELQRMLDAPELRQPTIVLAGLVCSGVLRVRVATVGDGTPAAEKRIFHDKVGLFWDQIGNVVGFRGSMNETYLGLAIDGNLESIDVFPSWCGGRDAERASQAAQRFEALWSDAVPGVRVRDLPSKVENVLREVDRNEDWDAALEGLTARSESPPGSPQAKRVLRTHQREVLNDWKAHSRRGLAVMATGTGKTALGISAIADARTEHFNALVLVPSALLLQQWLTELSEWLPEARLLPCGGGDRRWSRPGFLRRWLLSSNGDHRIAVATLQTASATEFCDAIGPEPRLLVVADEAHRIGSPVFRRLLAIDAEARLGLTATPDRFGDVEGTAAVMDYFAPVLQPQYPLQSAIRDGILTPYAYHPHPVQLSDDEQAQWDRLTRGIVRLVAGPDRNLEDEGVQQLLVRRARVAKGASGKVALAHDVLTSHFRSGDRWLVYCDDRRQLEAVRSDFRSTGIPSTEYHSGMPGDRRATLDDLDANGGVVLSIRCLDEGVDLPAVTCALILASSRNPREFVQRRGRILRRHPGKHLAHLHDAVVVPSDSATSPHRLLLAELARAIEFGKGAMNPDAATDLEVLCSRYGIDFQELITSGEEEDETHAD